MYTDVWKDGDDWTCIQRASRLPQKEAEQQILSVSTSRRNDTFQVQSVPVIDSLSFSGYRNHLGMKLRLSQWLTPAYRVQIKNTSYRAINSQTLQVKQCTDNVTMRSIRATISCCGKTRIVTCSECVFVALVIQHSKRMRRIVIRGLSGSSTFFHIIS
jgi:hypothetical protein